MQLFFSRNIINETVILDEQETRHCIRVLRLGIKDRILVTDGQGRIFDSEIVSISGGKVTASILGRTETKHKVFRLHVAIAPPKSNERFEWFVEKSAEIGIDEITPLLCIHSEKTRVNPDRLQKILVSAMKQSLSAFLPRLNEPQRFMEIIRHKAGGMKLIASALAGREKEILNICSPGEDITVLIGPEGDFSSEEIEAAVNAGFQPVSLGENRLRTETAGVLVVAAIHLLNRLKT